MNPYVTLTWNNKNVEVRFGAADDTSSRLDLIRAVLKLPKTCNLLFVEVVTPPASVINTWSEGVKTATLILSWKVLIFFAKPIDELLSDRCAHFEALPTTLQIQSRTHGSKKQAFPTVRWVVRSSWNWTINVLI
jgi:hypothetical protein